MSLVKMYDKMAGINGKKKPRCRSCGDKGPLAEGLCVLCSIAAQSGKVDEMIMKVWRQDKRLEENMICLEEQVKGLREEFAEFIKGETNDPETVYTIPNVPPTQAPEEEKG